MDGTAALWEACQQEFGRVLNEHPELKDQLAELSDGKAADLGRRAARAMLAPLMWGLAVGERWEVRRAAEFLGVTRQALYKRIHAGSVLALPGQGTTWFPTWQFDPDRGIVRPVTGEVLKAFREADPRLDPQVVAAWANSDNPHLDGRSPAAWLEHGGDDARIVVAARRAASRLAA